MAGSRLHHDFDHWLRQDPDRPYLLLPNRVMTFAQLGEFVQVLENELRVDGVQPGDRLLVVAENCPEHVALLLACSRVGAWTCGVNARMSAGEIEAYALVSDVRSIYFTSDASRSAAEHASRYEARPSRVKGLLRSPTQPGAVPERGEQADEVASIIFTSGTTGRPKGVLVTHQALSHFARATTVARRLTSDDRLYAFVPMTHIFGLGTVLASSLHSGAALVMRSRFDPDDVVHSLAREKVSMLQGPPTMFVRLLSHLDERRIERPLAPQLRFIYTGAAPLDLTLKRRVEERFGLPLHHGYSCSEAPGVCVTPMDTPRDDTAAGYPFAGVELRIVNLDGTDTSSGEPGEIWIRGGCVTPGYFRDEEATRQAFRPGGWYASGDLGKVGADGALFVVGRLKEMIIRSGFKIYPAEVEAVLNEFPTIQRSAVVGRPGPDGNEEVEAFVEMRPGLMLNRPSLEAFMVGQLAPYKRPSVLHVVDALPMTESGKILKRELLKAQ